MDNNSLFMLPDGRVTNEAIINMVNERRMQAQSAFNGVHRKTRSHYDFYICNTTGNNTGQRNNIAIPLLFSYIWTNVATQVNNAFSVFPFIEFPLTGGPGAAVARHKNNALVSGQMLDCNTFTKSVDFLSCANIYGTAFAMHGWKHQEAARVFRRNVGSKIVRVKSWEVIYDGPDWINLDILDVLPQPGKKTISEASWCIVRYFMDLDDIEDMMHGDNPMFDAAGVRALKKEPNSGLAAGAYQERSTVYRSWAQWQLEKANKYAKPVEIIEMWGKVPSEFAIQGDRNVVISIANGKHVLRYEPNPYDHGRIPILHFSPMPNPNPGQLHGTGKVEIGIKMQAAANRILNQRLDVMDVAIDNTYLASADLGLPENLISRAGRVFKVNGPIDDSTFRPLSPDLRGAQMAFQDLEQLSRYMQQGTGIIDDTVAGIQAGNRTTAREFVGRQEKAQGRLMLESMLFEHAFLSPLADAMCYDNQQFLTTPKTIARIGKLATENPYTGEPLPQYDNQITLEELNAVWAPRAIGATRMLSKATSVQDLLLITQTAQTNPVGMQIMNWHAMFKELIFLTNQDPAELLTSTIPAVEAYADTQGAAFGEGAGAPPPSGLQGGGSLEDLGSPGTYMQ